MTKAEFTKELEKLSIHLVLNYFQYGLTGTYNTANGCSLEQYIMPELLEVRKLGWQAQVPLKVNTDKMFYSSRYGKGENSVIFMGNPYQDSVLCKAEVGNDILGPHDYLWVRKMRDKAETLNKVQNKKSYFDVKLASRIPILYESVCALSNLPSTGITVKVAANKDINKIVYTLKFIGNKQFITMLKARAIEGYKLNAIKVNGKVVNSTKVTVLPNCQITLEYNSKNFSFSKQELMAFSFGKNSREVDFEIVLPLKAQTEISTKLDYDEIILRCENIANKIKEVEQFNEEPIIILLVHEATDNPCSERRVIQEWFASHGKEVKEWNSNVR